MSEIELKTYTEVLKLLDNRNNNHLLLGNGFNLGLGVDTNYKAIFEKMTENDGIYKKAKNIVEQCDYDLEEFIFNNDSETQNLFFLHGAFHIYRDGQFEKKITQTSDKALYNRLEEILNSGDKDIVCVFQEKNKIEQINESKYLSKALAKLSALTGSMVLIGCSLSENDKHVFDSINKSLIDTIYIASKANSVSKDYKKARGIFNKKNIVLFDRDTISYECSN